MATKLELNFDELGNPIPVQLSATLEYEYRCTNKTPNNLFALDKFALGTIPTITKSSFAHMIEYHQPLSNNDFRGNIWVWAINEPVILAVTEY